MALIFLDFGSSGQFSEMHQIGFDFFCECFCQLGTTHRIDFFIVTVFMN